MKSFFKIDLLQTLWVNKKLVRQDQVEIVDIFDYVVEGTLTIEDAKLIDKVRLINPGITIICICYSHMSQIHMILAKAGVLSKEKLERDLQLTTKGKCISLDETQKELLRTVAEERNINKVIIVHGPEGSGKYRGNDSYFRLLLSKLTLYRQNTLGHGSYQNEIVSLSKKIEHEDFPSKGKSSSFCLWILCWRSKSGCIA